jgi:hypothetical protein
MTRRRRCLSVAVLTLGMTLAAGCRGDQALAPSPTLLAVKAPTATLTPAPTAPATPTPTPRPKPSATPSPTPDPTAAAGQGAALPVIDFTAITSTLDSGWVQYELPDQGFSVALPPGWTPVDVSAGGLTAMIEMMEEQNPQLGGFLGSEAMADMVAEGMVFYALDSDPATLTLGMPPTINVLKMDTGIALPLDMVVALTLGQLEGIALPEVPITNERVDLNGIEAEVIRYVGDLSSIAGDPLQVGSTQLVIPFGGKLYVVSLSAPLALGSDYQDLLAQIAASFQLLN